MHDLSILITFTASLALALIFGYVAVRLKLSPIVGYLLAGVLVGPFTPGFVANRAVAEQFAEIGVILLLFGIGLRFHFRELIAVWHLALPGALIQSAISTCALALLMHLMGWDWVSGIILGMAVSVASTVVMALVLSEWHDLDAKIGRIAIGWTVVEDILTVAMLLLLPILFTSEKNSTHSIGIILGLAGLKIAGLVVVVSLLGKWVIPWALEKIAKSRSRELFTLAVLVLAIGTAVGSAKIFGVSMALGAFLAGLIVSRSEFAFRAANDALPMRDAFAVLFFVSVGMLFNPLSLVESPLLVVTVLVVVIFIKPIATTMAVRILGQPSATAIPVGAAFSQIGEFSFILGAVALNLGLINQTAWNALVATAMISITFNPYVYRWARRMTLRKTTKSHVVVLRKRPEINPNRCILIGYGPVGKVVHRLLVERGVELIVIDYNLQNIRSLHEKGFNAMYGDVLRPGTLEGAGISTSGSLVISTNIEGASEIVKHALQLNPDLKIIARCTYLADVPALRQAGAQVVFAGEAEVGVAMAEVVIADDIIACSDLAEHRESIRRDLYDSPIFPK